MPAHGPPARATVTAVASSAPTRHVAVLGLMGAGKTTVAHALGALLGRPVSDSDAAIEEATGATVRELRDRLGVDAMHD